MTRELLWFIVLAVSMAMAWAAYSKSNKGNGDDGCFWTAVGVIAMLGCSMCAVTGVATLAGWFVDSLRTMPSVFDGVKK